MRSTAAGGGCVRPLSKVKRRLARLARASVLCVAVLASAVASAGCGIVGAGEEGLRVLFIGNSLTYTNDLPAVVAALAEAGGQPISYEMVAYPDVALMDHWQGGAARGKLRVGGWDVVVMQQGPSSLPENQENLRQWATTWAGAAREQGASPALYMVWPAEARAGDFPGVVTSYTNAAEAAGALLFPAGTAWRRTRERAPDVPLYGPDGFHPTETGTYLAALVVYGGLTGASLLGLPARLDLHYGVLILPEEHARLLQEVAAEVLAGSRPPRVPLHEVPRP